MQTLQSNALPLTDLPKNYEESFNGKELQFTEELLENTSNYIHIAVSVSDGTFFNSAFPVSSSFIMDKKVK